MGWTSWEKVAGWGFEELIYEKKYHTELEGGVARITINRPQRMNTLGPKVLDMMTNAFYEASNDSMIGVVVLTGVGDRAFCVGGDVDEELETAVAGTRGAYFWKILPANRGVRMCRKPVIARVNGYCIGGGNHLAYWCDFTIAADHAIFGQNGPRVSSPADANIVSYLTYVVGAKKARELWMLCRRYTAQEALEMGLVNKVVPFDKLDEEVDKWCGDILLASPACIEIVKRTFDTLQDSELPFNTIANTMYSGFFEKSPEGREGQAAFLEKRLPRFWKIRKAQLEAGTKEG